MPFRVATVPFAGFEGEPHSAGAHVGDTPLQAPSAWHVLEATPTSMYPAAQEYIAALLYVVPLAVPTVPFDGAVGAPQSTTGHVGEAPDHAPELAVPATHVRVAVPFRTYPVLQLNVARALSERLVPPPAPPANAMVPFVTETLAQYEATAAQIGSAPVHVPFALQVPM